jgi:hypothetical protein
MVGQEKSPISLAFGLPKSFQVNEDAIDACPGSDMGEWSVA